MEAIKRWYFNRIPNKGTNEFTRFLGNAHQLGLLINRNSMIARYQQCHERLPSVPDGKTAQIPRWVGHEIYRRRNSCLLEYYDFAIGLNVRQS
jgi:hypothetical protein